MTTDGCTRDWSQGTAVQVHLPAEALRVLPPSPGGDSARAASDEVASDAGAALEVGAS